MDSRGGGGNLVGRRYSNVTLFRGNLFMKVAELWISVSETCAELWVTFQERCRIMGSILEKCYKTTRLET